MKRWIFVLFISLFLPFFTTAENSTEAVSYRRFLEKNWRQAAGGYEQLLKSGAALSSTEQYGRAIVAAAQLKDVPMLFFFVRKFQEDTNYSGELSKCIYDALSFAGMDSLLERTLFFISDRDYSFMEQVKRYVITYYMNLNRFEDVRRVLNGMLTEFPRDPYLLRIMANFEYAQGDEAESIRLAKRALEVEPKDLDLNLLLGNIYLQGGEHQLALLKERYKETSQKRGDLMEYESQLDLLLREYMEPATRYLEMANHLQSSQYLRGKLHELATMRERNQKALTRIKAYH